MKRSYGWCSGRASYSLRPPHPPLPRADPFVFSHLSSSSRARSLCLHYWTSNALVLLHLHPLLRCLPPTSVRKRCLHTWLPDASQIAGPTACCPTWPTSGILSRCLCGTTRRACPFADIITTTRKRVVCEKKWIWRWRREGRTWDKPRAVRLITCTATHLVRWGTGHWSVKKPHRCSKKLCVATSENAANKNKNDEKQRLSS